MPLLHVSKPAETVEEARQLVEQTRKGGIFFDIPTVFISDDDFPEEKGLLRKWMSHLAYNFFILTDTYPKIFDFLEKSKRHLADRFDAVLNDGHGHCYGIAHRLEVKGDFRRNINTFFHRRVMDAESDTGILAVSVKTKDYGSADAVAQKRYNFKDPLSNIVAVSNSVTLTQPSSEFEQLRDHFYIQWHEIAHGTGAGDPQADMMAAVVTRQAFAQSAIVSRIADKRAMDLILGRRRDGKIVRSVYGWGIVDANDIVAAMPVQKILDLSEAQIKALRFVRFDPLEQTVKAVSKELNHRMEAKGPQESAQTIAIQLAETVFSNDPQARYICSRFAVACERMANDKSYEEYQAVRPQDGAYPSLIDGPEFQPPA